MAKLHIYGATYDRMDGRNRFKTSLDRESIIELFDLKKVDEDAYEGLLDEHDEYFLVSAIMDEPEAEESVRGNMSFWVFVEEHEFGVGPTMNAAKLAYLEGEEAMS